MDLLITSSLPERSLATLPRYFAIPITFDQDNRLRWLTEVLNADLLKTILRIFNCHADGESEFLSKNATVLLNTISRSLQDLKLIRPVVKALHNFYAECKEFRPSMLSEMHKRAWARLEKETLGKAILKLRFELYEFDCS